MSRRRVFDIDFPENVEADAGSIRSEETLASGRRGPMAAAIDENAQAVSARQDTEAVIRQENDALAAEFVRLKKLGLIVDLLPIDRIRADKLSRDRAAKRDPEIDELKQSIRAIGLSNPIRVEQIGDGYELVQGYRRLQAFRELYAESKDDCYARIPAGLVANGQSLEALYRRMVDENLIRRDVSFAELADLARGFVRDVSTEARTVDEAIGVLYCSAGRQKRNYIGHFATMLDHIGDDLKFAESIPRSVGLSLAYRIKSEVAFAGRVKNALRQKKPGTAVEEVSLLRGMIASKTSARTAKLSPQGQAKMTMRYEGPGGMVRCLATEGRLILQAERDFSGLDQGQLEAAIDAFFKTLDSAHEET